ncbi:hypothetical protein HHK36_011644 [Tetracentron sinense]|uniref:Uncharacterized protein n=1 Tax=Tetracentron sinense TaxID=13715 RepID=A0A834ZD87_TETSI|nr:hypothetical protein HHK36_011644 [Tetracentron sinense]
MLLRWKRKVVESTHIPSVGGRKGARVSAESGSEEDDLASLGKKGESREKTVAGELALSPLIQQVEALNKRFREQPPNDVLAEGLELVENGLGLDDVKLNFPNKGSSRPSALGISLFAYREITTTELYDFRPQALADHRALLASLGWQPALLTSETEIGKNLDLPNPLVQREARQLDLLGHKREHNLGLWPIDELVSPIAARVEHHFSKWADQPKFMFALVYKITRDFVVGVDDVLQPLIDKARVVDCSAKEAWVSAMVKMLSGYLAKRILSALAERYTEKNAKLEVIAS